MSRKNPEDIARKLYQSMLQEQEFSTILRVPRAKASAKVAVDLVLDALATKHTEDYDFEESQEFAFWEQVRYWIDRVS